MAVEIGQMVPNFGVSSWVQGDPTNFDQERDHIVVLEVFQVNCPGCFMYAIPDAIRVYHRYQDDGVRVLGLATAFEDFDKNTLDNLRLLAETGQVIGETKRALAMSGQLQEGDRLPYEIPFPLGMDNLTRMSGEPSHEAIMDVIYPQTPDFDSQPENYRMQLIQRVKNYLRAKEYSAETFEKFALRGTPSTILVYHTSRPQGSPQGRLFWPDRLGRNDPRDPHRRLRQRAKTSATELASLREYAQRTRTGYAFADNVGFIVDLPERQSFSPDAAFYTGELTMKFSKGHPSSPLRSAARAIMVRRPSRRWRKSGRTISPLGRWSFGMWT